MKRQRVGHSADDMLQAFEYRLYQMRSDSATDVSYDDEMNTVADDVQASWDTEEEEEHTWTLLRSKDVRDSDGFMTDYSLYDLGDGRYGCVFGDKDLYNPSTSWLDVEFDNEAEAEEWFDNYSSLADDDYAWY